MVGAAVTRNDGAITSLEAICQRPSKLSCHYPSSWRSKRRPPPTNLILALPRHFEHVKHKQFASTRTAFSHFGSPALLNVSSHNDYA